MTSIVRPSISVMVPVYEPTQYLNSTLNCVLAQLKDFAPNTMEIVVVDDASPTVNVAQLINHIPGAENIRVVQYQNNAGLGGNWNRAIEQARGEFIHILHQDDMVLPGFYRHLCGGLSQHPLAGMGFTRHAIMDANGKIERVSRRERFGSGLLAHWLTEIAMRTRIQCPAVIVRKSTYETLGGYRTDLIHALDWEMWVRIAVNYPVYYEPRMLALFRRHAQNESARLASTGAREPDVLKTIEIFSRYLPDARREKLKRSAYEYFARSRLKQSRKLIAAESQQQAMALLRHVRAAIDRLPPGWTRSRFVSEWNRLKGRAELLA